MKFRIVKGKLPWMFWADGMVLVWFVLLKDQPSFRADEILYRHELQHCYQMEEKGRIRFYLSYLWELIRKGYRGNKYEKEAFRVQYTRLTSLERHWYDKKRVVLEDKARFYD